MKQFSLEEYLKDPSKKVVTRDERNVRIRCTDRKGKGQPIVALVETPDRDEEYVGTYRKDGRWSTSGCASELDLFFAPEKREGWVNIYRTERDESVYTANVYNSKEEAEDAGRGEEDYIATVKIEWEE